ncbi:Lin0368 family putative glycerol transporter subunit [Vaginisenegalia massiliensis]|uniref:Lin0368 family putative glycerol transporter subunit n=1 Tax=Vaginisenegalia massiliensis TaxID=2058294 RepID=UPI000F549C5D|nr:hypothetical protein [Vaginisenegalia massiliensis]
MNLFRKIIGYTIAGTVVMAVWPQFGIFGGYLAALIIIAPLWFMNHYVNLVGNLDDAAFVDMGLAIGVAGIVRDTSLQGVNALNHAIPTIILVIIGGLIGGYFASLVEKDMEKKIDLDVYGSEENAGGM